MKKAVKVLLFVIAMFITVGVKAMDSSLILIEDPDQIYFKDVPTVTFHFKMIKGNSKAYAFCLDSNKSFESGSSYDLVKSISGINGNSIRNVVFKAYADGLGTDHNVYGLSNYDFYAVTQMAVWNAAHGSEKGGMRSDTYKNWLAADSLRQKAYDALVKAGNPVVPKYEFSMNSNSQSMTISTDKKYFVSDSFKVNGSSNLVYTVKANDGSCVLYGDSCKATQVVKAGEEFKLRANYVADKEVNVSATVTSSSYLTGYDFALYVPNADATGAQNLSVFIPTFDKFTTTVSAKGYDESNISGKIEIQKVDENGKKVEGAVIGLYNSNDKLIKEVTSTGPKADNLKIELNAGNYYIKEISAPKGFYLSDAVVKFSVDKKGNVKDEKGNVVTLLTITDKITELQVSKTDATGQEELPGATLTIKDSTGKVITSWTSEEGKTHLVEGLNVGEIYNIVEDAAPKGYARIHNSIYFKLNEDGKVTTCDLTDDSKDKTVCNAMSTEDILNIKNEPTKLQVSKTDATGQEELGGAELVVKDSTGKVVDSWTSEEGKTHLIEGLIIDEIYEMIETVAPDGFAPLKTSIFFKLNDDGKVTTCNIVKGSNGENVCEAMSTEDILKIKNDVTRVVISKKDLTNGKGIKGAHLQILDEKGNVVKSWESDGKAYEINGLPIGKYTLIETVAADNYQVEMIINGDLVTKYDFEIKDGETVIIDVYNKIIEVPSTGISAAGIYAIGGLAMLIGIGTVIIARRKENV